MRVAHVRLYGNLCSYVFAAHSGSAAVSPIHAAALKTMEEMAAHELPSAHQPSVADPAVPERMSVSLFEPPPRMPVCAVGIQAYNDVICCL